jgi:hypothetical protein
MRDLFARVRHFYDRIQIPMAAIGLGVVIFLFVVFRTRPYWSTDTTICFNSLGFLAAAIVLIGGIMGLVDEFRKRK